ncbi:hypothetical protein ACEN9J_07705 [Variovorax sp. Varisp41]|uniref:virion core protein, T7 gp14 family n=1 Tax=Variovorax sp. Varisp41 TaxID=3243033 RepID=UPI0039B5D357
MCDIITPTVLLVASMAASAGTAIYSQKQNAKAVNRSNETQRIATHAAAIENYSQANRQGIEDRENASVEGTEIARERAARLGSARVSAGAAGIGGASVDALLLDLSGKGLAAGTTSEMNYARQQAARQDQVDNIGINQRSQLSRLQDVKGPGFAEYLGAGLKVANTYASTQIQSQQRIGK